MYICERKIKKQGLFRIRIYKAPSLQEDNNNQKPFKIRPKNYSISGSFYLQFTS